MIESFKKTLLAGLGAAVLTTDKVLGSLDDLVKQGKISATDARTVAEKLAREGRREFDETTSKLGEKLRELLAHFDSTYLKRIESLEARVTALETKKTPKPRATPGSGSP